MDTNTARFVKFQKNAERDATEVVYAAELAGYQGECHFQKNGVDVVMDLTFEVTAGPAATPGVVEIPYFVAIPQYYPKPAGKRVMSVGVRLPARPGSIQRVVEHGVHAFLPLRKDEPAAAYDVFVGLQMSDADADYNRLRREHQVEELRKQR